MADRLISMYEASKVMNTSKASVGRWAAQGLLTTFKKGRQKKFYLIEVLQVKEIRERGIKPYLLAEELLMTKYKLSKMERLIESITTFLNIPDRLQVFTDAELNFYYEKAIEISNWETFDARKFDFMNWIRVLKNIHEEEMKRLKILRGDPVAFVPFMLMCGRIVDLAKINKSPKSNTPIKNSEYVHLFLLARNCLRDRAITFVIEEPPDVCPIKRVDQAVTGSRLPPISIKVNRDEGRGQEGDLEGRSVQTGAREIRAPSAVE